MDAPHRTPPERHDGTTSMPGHAHEDITTCFSFAYFRPTSKLTILEDNREFLNDWSSGDFPQGGSHGRICRANASSPLLSHIEGAQPATPVRRLSCHCDARMAVISNKARFILRRLTHARND